MPANVQFTANVAPHHGTPVTGVTITVQLDADGSGRIDAAESFAMFPNGPGAFTRLVQIAADAPEGTPFVVQVKAPAGTSLTVLVQHAATGATLYETKVPVIVSGSGHTWLAGTL